MASHNPWLSLQNGQIWLGKVPFVAEYKTSPLTDTNPQTEDIKIILAAPEAFNRGCASWDKW